MAKQTFTSGQVLTAAEMNSLQENDYNWTVTTKTASYTLAAGDEGTRIVMNNAGATTITVDDGVFSAGDVVWIHNIGAGTCTITAGTATVSTVGELALEQYAGGHLYFTSASAAIFFPTEQGGGGKILQVVSTTKTDTFSASVATGADSGAAVSVTITPTSATSKVLVIADLAITADATAPGATLYRGGSVVTAATGDAASSRIRSTSGMAATTDRAASNTSFTFLDSPATTSATTYDVRLWHESGVTRTVYMNRGYGDADANTTHRSVSTLTVMEVSA